MSEHSKLSLPLRVLWTILGLFVVGLGISASIVAGANLSGVVLLVALSGTGVGIIWIHNE